MLLHSRGKAGERQETDLNALLAEYTNLAYHGMRAQDQSFNVKIETDFDPAVGKVNVVPQDLSRAFLNIVNNACYAANDKKEDVEERLHARRAGEREKPPRRRGDPDPGQRQRHPAIRSGTRSSIRSSPRNRPAPGRDSAFPSPTTSSRRSTKGRSVSTRKKGSTRSLSSPYRGTPRARKGIGA